MIGKYEKFIRILICLMSLSLAGCYTKGHPVNTAPPAANTPAMANPAAQKCLEEGYALEPIVSGGVPTGHFCVNSATGQRCEVWKYYRGECRMRKK